MYILGILLFVIILIIVRVDYVGIDKDLRQCPRCGNIVKTKFDLKNNRKQFSISHEIGRNTNSTIYKCNKCGNTWNYTYEIDESAP